MGMHGVHAIPWNYGTDVPLQVEIQEFPENDEKMVLDPPKTHAQKVVKKWWRDTWPKLENWRRGPGPRARGPWPRA